MAKNLAVVTYKYYLLKGNNRNTRKMYIKYPNLIIKSRSGAFIGKTYFRTLSGVCVTKFKQAIGC